MITQIKFTDKTQNYVEITLEAGEFHYAAYPVMAGELRPHVEAWVAANGAPADYVEPVAIVSEVSAVQALLALKAVPTQNGASTLRADVEALIASLPADDDVRTYFERATVWRRSSSVIAQVAATLGLSDADVDALFLAASQID